MNIFIMILVAVLMTGFYMMTAPSQRMEKHETEYAVAHADLRGVAECAAAAHNAALHDYEMDDICIEQNDIISKTVCLGTDMKTTKCEVVHKKKPAYTFIVTTTAPLGTNSYNDMLEILEQNFSDAGIFGIFQDGIVLAGGITTPRRVPDGIVSDMELTDGQLVYITQYEIPDDAIELAEGVPTEIICPAGTVATYRFGRWQCTGYNTSRTCPGDTIWDGDIGECIPDESRRPLCASQQTAVMVDDLWECINPFPDRQCPANMVARLNYNTLEWECVADPTKTNDVKKCDHITTGAIYGRGKATLRRPQTSCTDCEKMVTDPDTCVSTCVPDPTKLNDARCYPAATRECSGASRAFYFGFTNAAMANGIGELRGVEIPIDATHSQNRKFNCLDCGDGTIDTGKSAPPYVAVCK